MTVYCFKFRLFARIPVLEFVYSLLSKVNSTSQDDNLIFYPAYIMKKKSIYIEIEAPLMYSTEKRIRSLIPMNICTALKVIRISSSVGIISFNNYIGTVNTREPPSHL